MCNHRLEPGIKGNLTTSDESHHTSVLVNITAGISVSLPPPCNHSILCPCCSAIVPQDTHTKKKTHSHQTINAQQTESPKITAEASSMCDIFFALLSELRGYCIHTGFQYLIAVSECMNLAAESILSTSAGALNNS